MTECSHVHGFNTNEYCNIKQNQVMCIVLNNVTINLNSNIGLCTRSSYACMTMYIIVS